jgi:hypothetical protein
MHKVSIARIFVYFLVVSTIHHTLLFAGVNYCFGESSGPFRDSDSFALVENKTAILEMAEQWKLNRVLNESLQEKLLRARTQENEIIITTATYGFKEFLLNWICSMKRFDLHRHLIIYTVDEKLAKELILKYNFDNVYLENRQWTANESVRYEQKEYRVLMMYRTEFIKNVLVGLNYRVLLADNDAVWLKDPLAFIKDNHSNKDMIGQNDSRKAREGREPLICGGFLYLNNTMSMKKV